MRYNHTEPIHGATYKQLSAWIPQHIIETYEQAKSSADCVNLARANRKRLAQDKSNIDRQEYWPQLQDKNTPAFLHDPGLANLIDINPMDTVNPDQDIAPRFAYTISRAHGATPQAVTHLQMWMRRLASTVVQSRLEGFKSCTIPAFFSHAEPSQRPTTPQCK